MWYIFGNESNGFDDTAIKENIFLPIFEKKFNKFM